MGPHDAMQGVQSQQFGKRDSVDSTASGIHSEQSQPLERAGSKQLASGRASRANSSRRRALGGASGRTSSGRARSKYGL